MSGLVITRREGEWFRIGDDITVTVVEVTGHSARLRIEAPADVEIRRSEHLTRENSPATNGIVIDESGNQQQWTAVYWRYHRKCEKECDSFAEAYRFLQSGEDYGTLSSDSIVGPDGVVLMDRQALWDAQVQGVDPDELFVRLSNPAAITAVEEDR